jgi:hypothetical protein
MLREFLLYIGGSFAALLIFGLGAWAVVNPRHMNRWLYETSAETKGHERDRRRELHVQERLMGIVMLLFSVVFFSVILRSAFMPSPARDEPAPIMGPMSSENSSDPVVMSVGAVVLLGLGAWVVWKPAILMKLRPRHLDPGAWEGNPRRKFIFRTIGRAIGIGWMMAAIALLIGAIRRW